MSAGWTETRVRSERRFDIWNEVPLVPQTTGMSCWAAAAAMVIGWRDGIPVDPDEVARGAGRWEEFRIGLHPRDVGELAGAWGLVVEDVDAFTVDALRERLQDHGPLWVGEASPGLHAVVLVGIVGDGSEEGTHVRINDPWPIGRGERYVLTFADFARNFRAAAELAGAHAHVLRADRRSPMGGRTAFRSTFSSLSKEFTMYDFPQRPGQHEEYGNGLTARSLGRIEIGRASCRERVYVLV